MIEMHDAMETCADDAMAVQRTAMVYTQPPDYAREHGELDKYRKSKRLNVLCKEAIEQSIRDNYRDNRLDADAVWRDVTAQFGPERTAFVLAMTVREKDQGLYCSYVVDKAHPILTDALITHARRELEREKKPSVMEKLQNAETPPRTAVKAAVPEL